MLTGVYPGGAAPWHSGRCHNEFRWRPVVLNMKVAVVGGGGVEQGVSTDELRCDSDIVQSSRHVTLSWSIFFSWRRTIFGTSAQAIALQLDLANKKHWRNQRLELQPRWEAALVRFVGTCVRIAGGMVRVGALEVSAKAKARQRSVDGRSREPRDVGSSPWQFDALGFCASMWWLTRS